MLRRFAALRRRLAREDGIALVLALGVTTVLGITGATTIAYATTNAGSSARSKADKSAQALAEAGLNYAYSTLYAASNPSMGSAVPEQTREFDVGTATWSGKLENSVWTLTGIGRVRNPTAPGTADVVRTVSARVRLGSSTRGSSNNAVWNYVYADNTSSCTTLGNQTEVNVPLYVRGSLCLHNSTKITGYALQVGGTLSLHNTATVGSSGAPITEAHIAGGCSVSGGTAHSPCSAADRVYAQKITTQPTALTKPPVDLASWYRNAAPGPMRPCTVGSMPGGFDTDTTLNRSRSAFDLTPRTAYDCRVYDDAGNLVGQISWAPGDPGTLTIAGTVFFDGDITMGQYSNAVYRGRATIYASGKISIGQQSSLCGVTGCTADWKANENLLAFVAGDAGTNSVSISNYSHFQGAIYAVGDYREGNNSTVWGPIIADQIYMQNSTLNHYVPIGTLLPGMPATYEESVSLSNDGDSWG